MAGFWAGLKSVGSAIGQAELDRVKNRGIGGMINQGMHQVGAPPDAPPPGVPSDGVDAFQPDMSMQPPPVTVPPPSNVPMGAPMAPQAPTPMSTGRIVTQPTIALLGENGQAEAVIPMNDNPDNKTSMSMLSSGRYRR